MCTKILIEYNHVKPNFPQHCPCQPDPIKFDRDSDKITPEKEYPTLRKEDTKYAQQVLGNFLYYAHTISVTVLHAISSISPEQVNHSECTLNNFERYAYSQCAFWR